MVLLIHFGSGVWGRTAIGLGFGAVSDAWSLMGGSGAAAIRLHVKSQDPFNMSFKLKL